MHLVGLTLQPSEEAVDAEPLLGPVAFPIVAAFDHPVFMFLAELVPRHIERHANAGGMARNVAHGFFEALGAPRFDGTVFDA